MTRDRYRRRIRWSRLTALGLLTLLVLGAGWLGLRCYRIWTAAAALSADAEAARPLLSGGVEELDIDRAVVLLDAIHQDLAALEDAARPFLRLAPSLRWVPAYGPDIEAAPTLLEIALQVTAAGRTVVEPLTPLLAPVGDPQTSGELTILEEANRMLARSRPQLQEALAQIQKARSARETLDAAALDPRLQRWVGQLDRCLPMVEDAVRGALLAPRLLGDEGPRTYLLLVQNEDELRATGGFISGVAQMTLREGRIEGLPFEDSYAVDDFSHPYPQPPEPLRRTMLAELWLFRDSNWSPDFPTAAQKAIELYTISREVEIDGMIAVDQRGISLLLGPLGPLHVAGVDEPVTGRNVLQVVRRAWALDAAPQSDRWRNRKDTMGQVLDATLRRLEADMDRERMMRLTSATLRALREKHLLIYLTDQEAAALLHELDWDGALSHPAGDSLMVVDTNVGFNKANAVVEERLDYTVDLRDPAEPRATVTVHHHHPVEEWIGPCSQEPRYSPTYAGMTKRCYYDYLRVYAPSGASLLHATPHPLPGSILLSGRRQPGDVNVFTSELGSTVFATFLVLRPGEDVETTFAYSLPGTVLGRSEDTWRYRLTVRKQPGTDARPVTVSLHLPADAEIVAADPPPSDRDPDLLTYDLDLRTDLHLDVIWRDQDHD